MKMKMLKLFLLPLLGLLAATQFGCASLGKPYEPVASVAPDKAVVYIYRPSSFFGAAVSYTVNAGTKPIMKLANGGYYPYVAAPGELELWAETETKSSVTLDLRAGDRKYVKGTLGIGVVMGRPNLTVVDPAVAEAEIKECKLIPNE